MLPLHIAYKSELGDQVWNDTDPGFVNWTRAELPFGVLTPGTLSPPVVVILQNTAAARRLALAAQNGGITTGTPEEFVNVKLYLSGTPQMKAMLLQEWPALGAGIELSFDQGVSYIQLSMTFGNEDDPTTWILLPGTAIAESAPDGELDPFPPTNRATVYMRIRTPETPSFLGLVQFAIVPDCDVI
jgi:hypothetical protein